MLSKPPALILAGGTSSRMGYDKCFAELAGRPMIAHVTERLKGQVSQVLINSNRPDAHIKFQPNEVLADQTAASCGPLSGIATGMEHFSARQVSHFITVSVDCPFLPLDLASRLTEALSSEDQIIIARSQGTDHPTIGLWPSTLHQALTNWLAHTDRYAVKSFLDTAQTSYVDFEAQHLHGTKIDPFLNINRPEELAAAEALLRSA